MAFVATEKFLMSESRILGNAGSIRSRLKKLGDRFSGGLLPKGYFFSVLLEVTFQQPSRLHPVEGFKVDLSLFLEVILLLSYSP